MADPLDVNAMDDISIITGCQIEPLIATPRSVMVAIDKFYGSDEVASALEEYAKEKFGDDDINEEINDDINNSPIVVLVKEMIEKAARQRASDIHIEPMENRFVSATVLTVPCMKKANTISRLCRRCPHVSRLSAVWISPKRENRRTAVLPRWLTDWSTTSVYPYFLPYTAKNCYASCLQDGTQQRKEQAGLPAGRNEAFRPHFEEPARHYSCYRSYR